MVAGWLPDDRKLDDGSVRALLFIDLGWLLRTNSGVVSGLETKKPRETLGFTGFLGVGDTELESVTSTMSTWRSNQLS